MLIKVLLPAPFSPTMAWMEPRGTVRSILSLATSAPKILVMPRISTAGGVPAPEVAAGDAAGELLGGVIGPTIGGGRNGTADEAGYRNQGNHIGGYGHGVAGEAGLLDQSRGLDLL